MTAPSKPDAGSTPSLGGLDAGLREKVAALRSAPTYDEPVRTIAAIETHFAWVFLTERYAYKLKKPVRIAHLDLSALEARRLACAEEVRLNQSLAPDVYLYVVPLTRRADGSHFIGRCGGRVIDWLVKMRRLPAEKMLDSSIATGHVDETALYAVGRLLAEFYRKQPPIEFDPEAYLARLSSQIECDRSDLLARELRIAVDRVERVAAIQREACARLQGELMLRAVQHRILEAHGDLRPEHVCLVDPPCIIDALEFSADLRTLDPAEELAFLWVECARLGSSAAGEKVLSAYRTESKDPITPELLNFYRSRRATVRAKLIAWKLRDPAVSELAAWHLQAHEYLDLAHAYAMDALLDLER